MQQFERKAGPCETEERSCAVIRMQYPKATAGPELAVQAMNDSITTSLAYLISSFNPEGPDASNQLEVASQQFLDDYLKFQQEVPDYDMAWTIETEGTILREADQSVTIQLASYSFTGGAHPNTIRLLYNFKTADGSLLTYEDIIADMPGFMELAEATFRQEVEIGTSDNLNEVGYFWNGPFHLPAYFALTETGLLLLYNTYEIGPYVIGSTEFEISYDFLEGILVPDSF